MIDRIPEVQQFPALRRLLLEVNSPPSAWQTAKCGVSPEKTVGAVNPYNAEFVHTSYIDVVLAEEFSRLRADFDLHQRLARDLAGLLVAANEGLEAHAELVVRRCYFHRSASPEESDAGYCLTLFLTGYGESAAKASENLESAMGLAGEYLLKSRPS